MWLICQLPLWLSVSHVNKVCMYKIWYWRGMHNKNVVVVVPHIFPRDLDRSWQVTKVQLDVCSSFSLVISVHTHHQFNFVCRYYFCIWPSCTGYRSKFVDSFFHSILGHDSNYHNIPVYNYQLCIWYLCSSCLHTFAHNFSHDILGHNNDYHNIPVYNYQLCIWYLCNSCLHTFAHSFFHDILNHSNYPHISVYNHQLCIRPFCNGCRCRFARSFFHGIHTH